MVDAIGSRTVSLASDGRLASVSRVVATPGAGQAESGGKQVEAGAAAKAAAAQPPVDAERVALIKRAVQNGTYPITPERVADRLIALSLDWRP